MKLSVRVRDLRPEDVADLDWSGGPEHIEGVVQALQDAYAGTVVVRVAALANKRLVGLGVVDFGREPDTGWIRMLAVQDRLQSLGIGRRLIRSLERASVERGRIRTALTVELDNPRARALYLRLGYGEAGAALDSWPVGGGRRYVAACTRMIRSLA